ncbi:MAG TPA: hypothetical protein VGG04_05440 [Candidatus Sulfotelmatobacter sp.]|jgi:hypothetical protein
MNERESFFRSVFARTVAQIETMNEIQVVDGLRALKASRDSFDKTLAFVASISLVPAEDSDSEISKLRSELSSKAHSRDSASRLSEYIENALKVRLETLRKRSS